MNDKNSKTEIRKEYISRRKNIDSEKRQSCDGAVLENFLSMECLKEYGTVLCYVSVRQETDTRQLIEALLKSGKRVALPRVIDREKMEFVFVSDMQSLEISDKGIPEPSNKEKYGGEKAICVVPGVCFDKSGNRIGYGGGYYDRFLCDKEVLKVALAYSCQINDNITPSENDISMDYIVTEKGIIRCADNIRRFK